MVQLQYRNDTVKVPTDSTQLVGLVNPGEREIIIIKNTSTGGEIVSIAEGLGKTAVIGQGITLNPGETYIESVDSGLIPGWEPFHIVASAGTATISLFERQNKK